MMLGFSLVRLRQMIKKEFKQLLRDPKAKPLLLGSPIIQFLLLSYAMSTDVEHISTVVVDHDRTATSRAMTQALTSTGYFQIVGEDERDERIARALDQGDAVIGVVIPPNFARDLETGRGAKLQALIDGSDASVATVAQSYVGQTAAEFGNRNRPTNRPTDRPSGVQLRARAWYNPSLSSRLFNVPAVMGTLLLMTCLMLTAMGVVREREIGTLDQLTVSPIKAGELMIGKLVPVFCVGIFHLCIFFALALLHFKIPFRGSVGALALAAGLYIMAALAIGLLISTVSRTQQEAFMLMLLTMLPTMVLSGLLSSVDSMPPWLQTVTLLNPIRHFLDIIRGVFLKGTGLAELWPQYCALGATVVAALAYATYRFKHSIS